MTTSDGNVRIAAVGDLHYGRLDPAKLRWLLDAAAGAADILVICGDLTDGGLPAEAKALARELAVVKIPMVAVLGNHDFETGEAAQITAILTDVGLRILDGEAIEVRGVGFAGVKGFAGGFGRGALGPWGEGAIKQFVYEAINEALKLETALSRLRTEHRVAVLHYSPIRGTVEGEPPEIYPYLGSSRLEEPLLRFQVDCILHGHAHNGALEGRTVSGAPVYNVSLPLLEKRFPGKAPIRVIELRRAEPEAAAQEEGALPLPMRRRASDRETA